MDIALSTLAQVFVSPLVGTISDHYGPAILKKIGMKWNVTEEMEKLSDLLLTIQDVLEDAEDKQVTNKRIRNWLRKLKDIAYDVEDLLDECATDALDEPESTGGIIDRAKMVERIKQLINKFDSITDERSKFNLISLNSTTIAVQERVDPRRETSSFPTEIKVYGRYKEKECIVNLMVHNINSEDLSIYAIVGIPGLGKTTLAQMVYNDNMVKSHFQIRRWVCVSEIFEVKPLIGDIIQSRSNNNSQRLEELQHSLKKILSGKRFLLILDDVWNEDPTKWRILKSSLTCGAKGSSIVVTTRSNKVASLMEFSHKCEPKHLSGEDCFYIFKHHAFAEGEGERYPNLELIGKQIVKKCGGVPLAAKALGGLLRFQRQENEWVFVKDSKLWDLPQDKDDSILPALRLSYKHLPQHLRQCFAYCSIFPKDYIMEKEVLIQVWMANGFLQPKGNMELEDIGNGIFNDLIWRSLFQDIDKDIDGNVVACKMHDLVHDLACSITRDECFSVVTTGDEELVVGRGNTTRHLALDSDRLFSPKFALPISQSCLRTFLHLGKFNFNCDVPPPFDFSNLIYLRVLDLSQTCINTLPVSIGNLKLLRYLDLSETLIALLPNEIFGNLRNLQTLKLRRCSNLEMLPENLKTLTNLRHLDIRKSIKKLVRMPVGMGQLKCLHMLSTFVVSMESGCGIGELQGLDHLRGTLEVRQIANVRDLTDVENANLIKKQNLRSLLLNWFPYSNDVRHQKLIADALQPPPNIERLAYESYSGSKFPSWMNSTCLSSLVEISLDDCEKCKHLPTLGLLPRLKVLKISCIPVKCIDNEFYSGEEESNMMKTQGLVLLFPALEELQFFRMRSLEEWKGWSSSSSSSSSSPSRMKEGEVQVSVFPVLKRLIIRSCPNLRTFPSLPLSIQHLELWECHEKIFERSLESLPNLSHLSIRDCPRWSLDKGMILLQDLTSLQELEIVGCSMLVSVPQGTQSLTSLKYLSIERCDSLKSLNNCLQFLTNLHVLNINDCQELELLPDDFKNLVSLQFLQLGGLCKLVDVPVVRSSTLEKICFRTCPGLTYLPDWITNQRLLRSLSIEKCKNVKFLPEGLQHLNALKILLSFDCHPDLDEDVKKVRKLWEKIGTR